MKKIEAHSSVLIVSDYFEKFDFIQNHLIWQSLLPVRYHNIWAAKKNVKNNIFSMMVIDLSLPIEPKLDLIKEIYFYQPDTLIITIGKLSFLNKTGVLSYIPNLLSIDSLYSFPYEIKTLIDKKISFQNTEFNKYDSAVHTLYSEKNSADQKELTSIEFIKRLNLWTY